MKKHAGSDYWAMVQMFYLQMDGITQGFLQKSQEENLPYGDFDVKHGIKLINFLAGLKYLKKQIIILGFFNISKFSLTLNLIK